MASSKGAYNEISFPRADIGEDDIFKLLSSLEGVRVKEAIVLPSEIRPSSDEVCRRMSDRAKAITGCSHGIKWISNADMMNRRPSRGNE